MVVFHLGFYSAVPSSNLLIDSWTSLGYVSVNLFFILSGYVLAWNYLDIDGRLTVSRRNFWLSRFARIYPAYALALLFALPRFIALAREGASPARGAISLESPWTVFATAMTTPLLLQSWAGLVAWNSLAWTLSVEAFFYFLFPYVAPRIGKASPRRLVVCGFLCWLLPLSLAALYCLQATESVHSGAWYPRNMTTFTEGFLYASPLIHLPEFLLGVVLARLFQRRAGKPVEAWQEYASTVVTIGLLPLLALLPGPVFLRMLMPLFGWLIYALSHGNSWVARTLSTPLLLLLGEASYSLYLFHESAIFALLPILGNTLGVVAFLLLIVGFSILVFTFVEAPCRKWIRERTMPDPPESPQAATAHVAGS